MLIRIDDSLFSEKDNLKSINYLISIFSEGRRYDFFCDILNIYETSVYANLLQVDKNLIEEYFNKIITDSTKEDFLIEKNSKENTFNIEEAKRYFTQPFTIILENRLNDGYFLDALIENFKKRSKKIKRSKENGWLNYGNGGGVDNISNEITAMMKSFDALPKENHRYLKCFVLIDSDKEHPNADSKPNRTSLFKFLNKLNIPYHELEKREIENYMPDEVIDEIEEHRNFIQVYLKLNNEQKDYFDLENGFDKNLKSYKKEVQDLYGDVSDQDFGVLRNNKIVMDGNFKASFPKLFLSERVTQETLKKRVSHQLNDSSELETILDKISRLL